MYKLVGSYRTSFLLEAFWVATIDLLHGLCQSCHVCISRRTYVIRASTYDKSIIIFVVHIPWFYVGFFRGELRLVDKYRFGCHT